MSEEKKVITCSECGHENEEQVKFCSDCGAKIEPAASADTAETNTAESGVPETEAAQPEATAGEETAEKAAENANYELEQSLLREEPLTMDSAPASEEVQTETIAPEPVITETIAPEATTAPVYVDVKQTTYTTVDESKPEGKGSSGFGIASMILGIVSLVCCCFWYLSVPCAIIAIILGIIAVYNKYDAKGMAIAGIVLGSISIVCLILLIVLVGSASMMDAMSGYY